MPTMEGIDENQSQSRCSLRGAHPLGPRGCGLRQAAVQSGQIQAGCRFSWGRNRPHGAADRGARLSAVERARRAQGEGAAALRGQGAQGRAERHHRPDRRHRLRPVRARSAAPIPMPTLDRLANDGRATTASTPPRSARRRGSALLTGRNHHTNNAGAIMEIATAFPGNTGVRPQQRHAARRDPAAERLQHGRVRQVPRDGAVGGQRVRARSIAGRRAPGSTSSTASSAARPTSGRR